MIPKILIVYGGHAGGRTEQLRMAIAAGVRGTGVRVDLREQPALCDRGRAAHFTQKRD